MARIYSVVLFTTALTFHFFLSTIGWNNPIVDLHGFRQTQTAITTQYFLKDGFRLNYETPVLGAPWSIPFEFPLYQLVTASLVKLFGLPLESSGRFVSLIFFYASLATGLRLLSTIGLKRNAILTIGTLILTSPIYLFWSRTFMIESLALFLSLAFLLLCIKFSSKPSVALFILAIMTGSLGALTKISTFILFYVPVILIFLKFAYAKYRRDPASSFTEGEASGRTRGMVFMILLGIPIFVSLLWTLYADNLKKENPLASGFITSYDLRFWNFGNTAQRLAPATWQRILEVTQNSVIGNNWFMIASLVSVFLLRRFRLLTVVCLLAYFSGPLIFTNLYFVHDYYFYATAIFLLTAVGLGVAALPNQGFFLALRYTILVFLVGLFLKTYWQIYFPSQAFAQYAAVDLGHVIEKATHSQDILLIYGHDWSPQIPYYAKRRAIMDRWNYDLQHRKIKQSLKNLGEATIGAMLVKGESQDFIKQRVNAFGLNSTPVFSSQFGELYLKTSDAIKLKAELEDLAQQVLFAPVTGNLRPLEISSALPPARQIVDGKSVLLTHAPSDIVLAVPSKAKVLEADFGILPVSYHTRRTDGVIISIEAQFENGAVRNLYYHLFNPVMVKADRNMQTISLNLLTDCQCRVHLKADPGQEQAWDWIYWQRISFQ